MRTIVEQTISDLDAIFEAELDRQDRKDRSRTAKKNNKTAVKKAVAKGRKKKRDDETLEQRAREKAIRELKKELMSIENSKDAGTQGVSKKQRVEDRLKTRAFKAKIETMTKKFLKELRQKERDKNKEND